MLTDRGRQFCHALAVARSHGRLSRDVIGRLMDLVASGGLDGLPLPEEGRRMAQENRRWPPPEEELRRLYLEQGLTHQQIADIYGVRREIVGQKLRRLGLYKRTEAQRSTAARRQPDWRDFARAVGSLLEMGGRVSVTIRIEAGGLEYRWRYGAQAEGEADAQQA